MLQPVNGFQGEESRLQIDLEEKIAEVKLAPIEVGSEVGGVWIVQEGGSWDGQGCSQAASYGQRWESVQDGCPQGARDGPPSPLEAFICSPFLGDFV